jgi:hypothetical protein
MGLLYLYLFSSGFPKHIQYEFLISPMCVYTPDPVNLIPLDDPNNTGEIANSMRLTGHASRMDDKRNSNRALGGKP